MGSHLVLLINVRCFCPLHLGQYALPLSLVPIYFNWSSIYFNWSNLSQLFAIITCSRPSILLSSMLWALAGTWPSNSEQRLLNQTFDGKSLNNLQFLQRIYMYQGAVLALFNTITNKRLSSRCFVSCGERSLQAHHDVLHHPRVWAPVTTRIVGFKSFINERGQTWRCSQGSQW